MVRREMFCVYLFTCIYSSYCGLTVAFPPEDMRIELDRYVTPMLKTVYDRIEDLDSTYFVEMQKMTNRIRALEEQHQQDVDRIIDLKRYIKTSDRHEMHSTIDAIPFLETAIVREQSVTIDAIPFLETAIVREQSVEASNTHDILIDTVIQQEFTNDTDSSRDHSVSTEDELRENALSTRRNRFSQRGQRATGKVAFHAVVAQVISIHGTNQVIPFDKIITNVGGHYSSNTGVFTCVTSGIHVFSWSIMAYSGLTIETDIVVNGNTVGRSKAGDEGYYDQGSATVIIALQPNDEVWIKVSYSDTGESVYPEFSMFSGFLLS